MSGGNRLKGGLIDRGVELEFAFNGKRMNGYAGDTLASALIANDRKLIGRSFKYHRPRGIFTSGSEEPNALVELRTGAHREPNTRATTVELFDGLNANSQNHHGPLERDLQAVNDFLSPIMSAGFYYKTFMWPKSFWEKVYEPAIRKAAGLGRLSGEPDPDTYDKGFLHCDLLIIGAGPAGLLAAQLAGRSGASVILADEDFLMGGRLNSEIHEIGGMVGAAWAKSLMNELATLTNVRTMTRTAVVGAFDHGIYGALERRTDHLSLSGGKPRQILWRINARRSILAAGALERSIAFPKNDRPGIMLAGAVRAYANRFAAAPGRSVTVFTNNDDGYRTARDLALKGVEVVGIVDTRNDASATAPPGVEVIRGGRIVDTNGRHGIHSVILSNGRPIPTDCLAVSGGWNPNVHLACHQRGKPVWSDEIQAFVPPRQLPAGMAVAGAAAGHLTLGKTLANSVDVARRVLNDLGYEAECDVPRASGDEYSISAFWQVRGQLGRAWVDLQNDVTTNDIKLSALEGFGSVEHMKRYTTLGMATDQGKTSNVLGLAILAEECGQSIPETGTTVFRPPYSPVAISAFAGRSRGGQFRPIRFTPSHKWSEEQGAVFVETGLWMRAQWFPQPGETHWRQSVDREVLAVRHSVGICDVTTLGKIDIQGRDATAFIDRVYANGFAKLPVGKVRYGLMLREDGIVMDDGTTARLGEQHYLITSTTANAVPVFRHLEFCRQCLWPELDVHLISATEQWAQIAVAGPNSRALLKKVVDLAFDLSNNAFPFMACGEITVCGGITARLFRISFSGELAYELAVPARFGDELMRVLLQAGAEFDVTPYGTEALGVLRIEKGHPAGNELDGRTTPGDLGMASLVLRKKDFIGRRLLEREGLQDPARPRMVGLKAAEEKGDFKAGAHLFTQGDPHDTGHDQGWISSAAYSPHLERYIGLGFLKDGAERFGQIIETVDPLRGSLGAAEIVSPHFIDPQGERLRG